MILLRSLPVLLFMLVGCGISHVVVPDAPKADAADADKIAYRTAQTINRIDGEAIVLGSGQRVIAAEDLAPATLPGSRTKSAAERLTINRDNYNTWHPIFAGGMLAAAAVGMVGIIGYQVAPAPAKVPFVYLALGFPVMAIISIGETAWLGSSITNMSEAKDTILISYENDLEAATISAPVVPVAAPTETQGPQTP